MRKTVRSFVRSRFLYKTLSFQLLTSLTFVTTRQNSSKLGSALAVPKVHFFIFSFFSDVARR